MNYSHTPRLRPVRGLDARVDVELGEDVATCVPTVFSLMKSRSAICRWSARRRVAAGRRSRAVSTAAPRALPSARPGTQAQPRTPGQRLHLLSQRMRAQLERGRVRGGQELAQRSHACRRWRAAPPQAAVARTPRGRARSARPTPRRPPARGGLRPSGTRLSSAAAVARWAAASGTGACARGARRGPRPGARARRSGSCRRARARSARSASALTPSQCSAGV